MKYRTVLCEDNKHVREVLNYIFKERGHEVFSFEDAGDCPLNYCHDGSVHESYVFFC
jgi:hypothetical protein